VLNEYCQSWDVKNLFVTDGAPFVSNADKNPTLSILALAWRTTDYVLDQLAEDGRLADAIDDEQMPATRVRQTTRRQRRTMWRPSTRPFPTV
jgi:choline dehydrogenase-like flavoprotein